MYLGVSFEVFVNSEENTSMPDVLTCENLHAARQLHARGFSNATLSSFLDWPLDRLADIPLHADLFTTKVHDASAIELLCDLCMLPGVKAANATKILYQKRPRLVPILDQYARLAIGLPWHGTNSRSDFKEMFRSAFAALRWLARFGENATILGALARQSAQVCDGVALSRVRIIDILAWMVGRPDLDYSDAWSTSPKPDPIASASTRSLSFGTARHKKKKTPKQKRKEAVYRRYLYDSRGWV
jgi:hypothetical protein